MEHFPHIILGLFVLCLIGGAILLRYDRNSQAQATPLPKASSGTRNPSSASHHQPMATLNRKQRRTLASLQRRGKV